MIQLDSGQVFRTKTHLRGVVIYTPVFINKEGVFLPPRYQMKRNWICSFRMELFSFEMASRVALIVGWK